MFLKVRRVGELKILRRFPAGKAGQVLVTFLRTEASNVNCAGQAVDKRPQGSDIEFYS